MELSPLTLKLIIIALVIFIHWLLFYKMEDLEEEKAVLKSKLKKFKEWWKWKIKNLQLLCHKRNLYTDVPKHARKWQERIIPEREIYNASTNQLIGIEGKIKGSVSIRKPVSDEQKAKMLLNLRDAQEKLKNRS